MKKNIKYISIGIFLISLMYLGFKFYNTQIDSKYNKSKIEFESNTLNLNNFKTDSIYRLSVRVKNNSDENLNYKLKSTCGCTVVGDLDNQITGLSNHVIDLSLNTYGKKSNFNSNIFILNSENMIIDTLTINASR